MHEKLKSECGNGTFQTLHLTKLISRKKSKLLQNPFDLCQSESMPYIQENIQFAKVQFILVVPVESPTTSWLKKLNQEAKSKIV